MSGAPPSEIVNPMAAANADGQPNDDDWSAMTEPAERRRRQNRINQRAFRRRKRDRANSNNNDHPKSMVESTTFTSVVRSKRHHILSPSERDVKPQCGLPCGLKELLLQQFTQAAYQSYTLGNPTADHLLTLTKVNVFRAFAQNLNMIGFSMDKMGDDEISPFSTAPSDQPSLPTELPPNLYPTKLQNTIPHHPWLDFFPWPKMRDNLISKGDDWDDEDLCHDLMGFWDHSAADAGLLVWAAPWDIRSWEVTESFLKKWQWVVRGCPELMDSTNAWRARRGEKLIFRYL